MKCPQCQREVPDDLGFCIYCGRPIKEGTISSQPTAPAGQKKIKQTIGEIRTIGGAEGEITREEREDIIDSRYKVLEVVGEGGMGKVYRCIDVKLNRTVAVKRLLPEVNANRGGISRFLREGQAIASLNHQNVVRIHDIGEDEKGHYIVMEFIEGETLRGVIRRKGKLEAEEIKAIVFQVGKALAYAHRKRVIHRDIKPGNIMLDGEGTVKITDFGLAQVAGESDLSQTGCGIGTLDYMPPEQRQDAKHTDHRADIYAFGATIYEMATGKPPRTVRESEIPPGLREVILKAMENKEEDRFFSIDEMLEGLRHPEKIKKISDADITKGTCPTCGYQNTLEARFCEECGAGIFEECPRCKKEVRIGTKYCTHCGANVTDFKKFNTHLAAASKYRKECLYPQAIEEYRSALYLDKGNKEAEKGIKEAERILKRIWFLRERAGEAREASKYEEEEKYLRQLLELQPGEKEALLRLNSIPRDASKKEFKKSSLFKKLLPFLLILLGVIISIGVMSIFPGHEKLNSLGVSLRSRIISFFSYTEDERNYDEALAAYLSRLAPSSVLLDKYGGPLFQQVKDWEEKGRANKDKPEQARRAFNRALELLPQAVGEANRKAREVYTSIKKNYQTEESQVDIKLIKEYCPEIWIRVQKLAVSGEESPDLLKGIENYTQAQEWLGKAHRFARERADEPKLWQRFQEARKEYLVRLERIGVDREIVRELAGRKFRQAEQLQKKGEGFVGEGQFSEGTKSYAQAREELAAAIESAGLKIEKEYLKAKRLYTVKRGQHVILLLVYPSDQSTASEILTSEADHLAHIQRGEIMPFAVLRQYKEADRKLDVAIDFALKAAGKDFEKAKNKYDDQLKGLEIELLQKYAGPLLEITRNLAQQAEGLQGVNFTEGIDKYEKALQSLKTTQRILKSLKIPVTLDYISAEFYPTDIARKVEISVYPRGNRGPKIVFRGYLREKDEKVRLKGPSQPLLLSYSLLQNKEMDLKIKVTRAGAESDRGDEASVQVLISGRDLDGVRKSGIFGKGKKRARKQISADKAVREMIGLNSITLNFTINT